jgi:hypothetical protein
MLSRNLHYARAGGNHEKLWRNEVICVCRTEDKFGSNVKDAIRNEISCSTKKVNVHMVK